jgi:glycosyltransferase involved in cell wall biosynthesis
VRILLATDWNRGRGGAEAYVGGLKRALRDAGHDVRLLTSSAGSAGDGEAEYVAYGTERLALQSLLQIANPFAVATAKRVLREFRPDVALVNMFAHHLSPAFVTALAPVPIVLVVSDYKVLCPIGTKLRPDWTRCRVPAGLVCLGARCVGVPHWLRDRPRYAWIRAAVGRASRVVACSRFVAAELATEGIPAEALTWPSPAPSPGYRREPVAEPTFLFCGRLDVEKGVELLLGAFAALRRELPEARLRIVGRGSREGAARTLARASLLRDATTFLGWLDPPDVERELARATALVAPSLWAEPLGLVAAEAILRGVPVIASAEGGFAETVVDRESGLLFPNGDVDALLDALRQVATGNAFPDRRVPSPLIAAASRVHSMEAHVAALEQILRDAI